jgi:hypothetical protein
MGPQPLPLPDWSAARMQHCGRRWLPPGGPALWHFSVCGPAGLCAARLAPRPPGRPRVTWMPRDPFPMQRRVRKVDSLTQGYVPLHGMRHPLPRSLPGPRPLRHQARRPAQLTQPLRHARAWASAGAAQRELLWPLPRCHAMAAMRPRPWGCRHAQPNNCVAFLHPQACTRHQQVLQA